MAENKRFCFNSTVPLKGLFQMLIGEVTSTTTHPGPSHISIHSAWSFGSSLNLSMSFSLVMSVNHLSSLALW